MTTNIQASTIASIAAAMALAISTATAGDKPAGSSGATVSAGDNIHCYNVSACKMYFECGAFLDQSCKSSNACTVRGFKVLTAKECLTKGGVISDINT